MDSHGDEDADCRKLLTCPPEHSGNPTSRDIWEQVGGMVKGVRILCIRYPRYINGSFACREILRHRTSSFTSHPKEGMLQIFIALKNALPWPGLNPRPLGPVASALTTTPLRQLLNNKKAIYSIDYNLGSSYSVKCMK
jgi:hypothetical protein